MVELYKKTLSNYKQISQNKTKIYFKFKLPCFV